MKVLLVRFSSIGDIVLTTPVIRCLKKQVKDIEIHYLTKNKFRSILERNPYVDKLYGIDQKPSEVLAELKAEKYDLLIDLHHNIRTLKLKLALGVKSHAFPKLNIKKWFLVYLKRNKMPEIHIVDRYFAAVRNLGVQNDRLPCDYFIPETDEIIPGQHIPFANYIAFAIGAQYATKKMPLAKLVEVLEPITFPLVFLGDQTDSIVAAQLCEHFPDKALFNACGKFSLNQSASIVRQAEIILTHDTGLMHIASAFRKQIVSVWGNTVPQLGMYPYMPDNENAFSMHEVLGLSCRPCSKIGFKSCPKKHFNCMNLQDASSISEDITKRLGA